MKGFVGDVFEKGSEGTATNFKLEFKSRDAALTPTETDRGRNKPNKAQANNKKRRALTPSTMDTELVIDVVTDGDEIDFAQVVSLTNDADGDVLGKVLSEIEGVEVTDLIYESNACVPAPCGPIACGWALDSCGETLWCGSCRWLIQ